MDCINITHMLINIIFVWRRNVEKYVLNNGMLVSFILNFVVVQLRFLNTEYVVMVLVMHRHIGM
jgi:hypothetical protein